MAEQSGISRRQFVVLAATCAAACACGDAFAGPASNAAGPVDVGTLADYPNDGLYNKFIRSNGLIVYRQEGQIYASTAHCPHKNALLQVKDGGTFCSKHGSMFSAAGTVTKGPARDSLVRYAISTNTDGHLIVDPSKSFREKKWDDPASFVKVG